MYLYNYSLTSSAIWIQVVKYFTCIQDFWTKNVWWINKKVTDICINILIQTMLLVLFTYLSRRAKLSFLFSGEPCPCSEAFLAVFLSFLLSCSPRHPMTVSSSCSSNSSPYIWNKDNAFQRMLSLFEHGSDNLWVPLMPGNSLLNILFINLTCTSNHLPARYYRH